MKSTTAISVIVPVAVVSEANQREHWAVKVKRKQKQQFATVCVLAGRRPKPVGPLTITLTRRMGKDGLGRKNVKLMDSDNLAGAFKHIRDALAKWLGRDDGDPSLTWLYRQEPSDRREVGVRIEEEGRQ